MVPVEQNVPASLEEREVGSLGTWPYGPYHKRWQRKQHHRAWEDRIGKDMSDQDTQFPPFFYGAHAIPGIVQFHPAAG